MREAKGLADEAVVAKKRGRARGAKGLWVRRSYRSEASAQTQSWEDSKQHKGSKAVSKLSEAERM